MGDINVKFRNNTSDNGWCNAYDRGRDPINQPLVFGGDVDSGNETDWFVINDKGELIVQAPGGPLTNIDMVHDGDTVNFSQ